MASSLCVEASLKKFLSVLLQVTASLAESMGAALSRGIRNQDAALCAFDSGVRPSFSRSHIALKANLYLSSQSTQTEDERLQQREKLAVLVLPSREHRNQGCILLGFSSPLHPEAV